MFALGTIDSASGQPLSSQQLLPCSRDNRWPSRALTWIFATPLFFGASISTEYMSCFTCRTSGDIPVISGRSGVCDASEHQCRPCRRERYHGAVLSVTRVVYAQTRTSRARSHRCLPQVVNAPLRAAECPVHCLATSFHEVDRSCGHTRVCEIGKYPVNARAEVAQKLQCWSAAK